MNSEELQSVQLPEAQEFIRSNQNADISDLGGFIDLLPYVMASPNQKDAGKLTEKHKHTTLSQC